MSNTDSSIDMESAGASNNARCGTFDLFLQAQTILPAQFFGSRRAEAVDEPLRRLCGPFWRTR